MNLGSEWVQLTKSQNRKSIDSFNLCLNLITHWGQALTFNDVDSTNKKKQKNRKAAKMKKSADIDKKLQTNMSHYK